MWLLAYHSAECVWWKFEWWIFERIKNHVGWMDGWTKVVIWGVGERPLALLKKSKKLISSSYARVCFLLVKAEMSSLMVTCQCYFSRDRNLVVNVATTNCRDHIAENQHNWVRYNRYFISSAPTVVPTQGRHLAQVNVFSEINCQMGPQVFLESVKN